ncbi:MAG: hypothetical protein IJ416_09470 [Ruminiclostridium sp.]|nr:hypothetical protein [Ruminiclostridium sp.]
MYFLKIGSVELPVPYYYSVETNDINSTDTYRSDETGEMHRRRIRQAVHTCHVKWRLSGSDAIPLHTSLEDEQLSVSLLDPAYGRCVTCIMYAENLKSVFYQEQDGDEKKSWWEISCTLVEY